VTVNGEIAKPVEFTRRLDLSEQRAIERRLVELEPYVTESAALKRRLANVHKRLGVESNATLVDRQVLALLDQHRQLARSLIIRDLGLEAHVVKSSLERLVRKGRVCVVTRGHYALTQSERATPGSSMYAP